MSGLDEGGPEAGGPAKGEKEGGPERLYIVGGGRGRSGAKAAFELVTLIVARVEPEAGMAPELAAVLRMCHFPLSVAELSAYLVLPVSTVSLLLEGLVKDSQVEARAPIPAAALPDAELLKAVMHGLQNL